MPRPLPLPLLLLAFAAAAAASSSLAVLHPREVTSFQDSDQVAAGGGGGGGGVASRLSARVSPHASAAPRLPLPTPQEIDAIRKVAQILAMLGQQVIPAIIGESSGAATGAGDDGGAYTPLLLAGPARPPPPPAPAQAIDVLSEPVDARF